MKVNFNRIIIPQSRDTILGLLTKFIQCKICMNLLNDPYDCLCCNQTFCKSCIINYIKTNKKCPFSEFFDLNKQKENNKDKQINVSDLLNEIKPSSSNFTKVIQSLKFYCQNHSKGCDVELSIEDILSHEKMCKHKSKNIKVEIKKNKKINVIKKNKKEKEKKDEDIVVEQTIRYFDSKNDMLQDNISNYIEHQDSIISFSGKKYFSDNNKDDDINHFNENTVNNYPNVSKLEKSIEQINQKLSYLNNYIINNIDNKSYFDEDKIQPYKNIEKKKSEFFKKKNQLQDNKSSKRNSMNITNNYYEGAYINTFNNNNVNSHCYNTSGNILYNRDKIMMPFKTKISKFNIKENNNKEKDKKMKMLYKSFKAKKNSIRYLLNEKEKEKEKNKKNQTKNKKNLKIKTDKFIELNLEKNMKAKINTKFKEFNSSKRNSITARDINHVTPKLGTKTQKNLLSIRPFD